MSDMAQDVSLIDEKLEPIIKVLEILCDKLEALEKVVMDEIIGGALELHKTKVRQDGLADFGSKYGEKIGGLKDAFGVLRPGSDMTESMYDKLEELRGSEGFDEGSAVDGMIAELQGIIDKLRGIGGEEKAEAIPEAVEAEPIAAIKVEKKTLKEGNPSGSKRKSIFDY